MKAQMPEMIQVGFQLPQQMTSFQNQTHPLTCLYPNATKQCQPGRPVQVRDRPENKSQSDRNTYRKYKYY